MNKLFNFWKSRYKLCLSIFILSMAIACSAQVSPSSSARTSEQARSAASFINSIGVAVHLNYIDTAYGNYEGIIKPRLKELGIRHIRDGVSLQDKDTQNKFNDLGNLGIRSTLVMDPRSGLKPTDSVAIAKAVSNSIEAVEGPNEWDVQPNLKYNEKTFPDGVRKFQEELYAAIKGDSATKNLDVLSPSMAQPYNSSKLGEVACDIGTMHSYAGGGIPSGDLDNKWIPTTKVMCGYKPIIATECGYHNAINKNESWSQPAVSEQASGKYIPRLFLEYFNRNIKRAYAYELIDLRQNNEANSSENNYGLLRNDGSPKPAFIAMKNLIELLQDSEDTFTQKSLEYLIKENTTNIHHTLLQKTNGSFYLILWQEVSSFNNQNSQDIAVPEQLVTLNLPKSIKQAITYLPVNSITPIKKYSNPKEIKLNVPDHPLVVELLPA